MTVVIQALEVAAVDAYCWLHKGASLFAEDVVIRNDDKKCIELCAAYLDVFEENNVTAVVVMDGRKLQEKIVNENRARARDENLCTGLQLWNENRRDEAARFLKQGANVSTKMALELIKLCRERHITYIVAPFEADAQIAFLQQNGFVDIAISEDSDLLVYRCDQLKIRQILRFDEEFAINVENFG
ncbi:exonuclease 1-like [Paramuricea clavata]|uniref:Exonuclease 1 n=1 Tax=Paramuricea clavata TaxID=317549 RepID=A0A7D9LAD3_PARCT|nr:exonuclease 1-like [Paramuricea clavata]